MGLAEENLQARIRGNILMAVANKQGALLLNTGNKTETALGYCTMYGDMAGALAVISDLNKTQVYAVSRWVKSQFQFFEVKKVWTFCVPQQTSLLHQVWL